MVVYDCLNVLVCRYVNSGGVVPWHCFGINVNDFPIPLVLEQQTFLVLSNDLQDRAWLAITAEVGKSPGATACFDCTALGCIAALQCKACAGQLQCIAGLL